MKTNLCKFASILTSLLIAATLMYVSGCASSSSPPTKSGFLSSYNHLKKLDDTTWRYVNAGRLASYNKFQITSVKVTATQFEDKPITPEGQQKGADYLREAITLALADRYPIVSASAADVGELRLAITDVYKSGGRIGLTVEGEVIDSYSTVQVAAVMRTELGEYRLGNWWDAPSARQIVDAWASRMRQAIDHAHGR